MGSTCLDGRRIPDRRGIGPLLLDFDHIIRKCQSEFQRIINRPCRCWNFQHTYIVKSTLLYVEIRILPPCRQFWCADIICPCAFREVDSIADRRQFSIRTQRAAIRTAPDDIIDFSWLFPLASTQPLTTWIRSRLALSGSIKAETRKLGTLPSLPVRSPPIGTPLL